MPINIHCPRLILHALLTAACLAAFPAQGVVFRVVNSPRPLVLLVLGGGGSNISEVRFNVPSGQLGSGTEIRGNPGIRVIVANRATPNFSRTAVLTADSSTPLSNGSATVPLSTIRWTSRDGHVPAGRYDDSSNQFLMSFPNSFLVQDFHRFYYENTSMLEAGRYRGRVTYTLAMP